mmetsp:Transcript_8093/g.19922  ORF Transcript_8093/g.19922 Transcript_8093/m.19922 type:complete len:375 (-) Transcript_8093:214-1338(-)
MPPSCGAPSKVTVLVTTSPIPSNPSTALIDTCLRGLDINGFHWCDKIILCDGFSRGSNHFKRGRIDDAAATAYRSFVFKLCQRADSVFVGAEACAEPAHSGSGEQDEQSPQRGLISVVDLVEHHGFALSLLTGINLARTEFVFVCQHDWILTRSVPLAKLTEAMTGPVRYIMLPAPALSGYVDIAKTKYSIDVTCGRLSTAGVSLLPLLMWYDKPHLCRRSDYLRRIFSHRFGVGEFVEDVLGRDKQLPALRQAPNWVSEHEQYGTYMLEAPEAMVYHLSGRKVRAAEEDLWMHLPSTPSNCVRLHLASAARAASRTLAGTVVAVPGLRAPPSTDTPGERRFGGRCYACGEKGHSFRFCPSRAGEIPGKQQVLL